MSGYPTGLEPAPHGDALLHRTSCIHVCKYCPDEDAHPDGFCICGTCGVRIGLSPKRAALTEGETP